MVIILIWGVFSIPFVISKYINISAGMTIIYISSCYQKAKELSDSQSTVLTVNERKGKIVMRYLDRLCKEMYIHACV